MKVAIFLSTAALVCLTAQAQAVVCDGNPSGSAQTITSASFIISDFGFRCSKNVLLAYAENTTKIAVCAASIKGNRQFGGHTDTGGVIDQGAFSGSSAPTAVLATGC